MEDFLKEEIEYCLNCPLDDCIDPCPFYCFQSNVDILKSLNLEDKESTDKRKEYFKEYYKKFRSKILQRSLDYYSSNKESIKKKKREYYFKNRKKFSEHNKRNYEKNRLEISIKNHLEYCKFGKDPAPH